MRAWEDAGYPVDRATPSPRVAPAPTRAPSPGATPLPRFLIPSVEPALPEGR